MCDCFHLAFPNWHAASSGTAPGRRLRAPEPGTEDDSTCDEPSQFTERERPRPQGSSPVEEFPETEKYSDSDKECEGEHDPHHKSGSGKKTKKSGLGSMFEKRSTPKMSKLKEVHSPESGVIVKTAKDGCAEGLVYGGGGKEGIFIKEVVPESPASKSLKLKEGDQILSATVYFDNVSYEDAIQILEHAQAYKVKLCLKRKPDITETEPTIESDVIPEEEVYAPEMREQGKTKRRGDARISWPKFPSFGKGRKSRFTRSHSSSEADEQRKLELSPTTSDTESPIKSQDALKGKKKHKMKLFQKRGRISSSEDQDTDAPTSAQMLSPECLESPSEKTPQVYVTEELKVVEDVRHQQDDQKLTEPVQHKVELIAIDSTLKTEDLTVALASQESPSGTKSPDGKKKKKERSELKMKILGKDKSHKKDAKAKSSPKRLKTLGASFEIADEKTDAMPSFESHTKLQGDQLGLTNQMEISVPKVELEISDAEFIQKSPQKGEDKTKKGEDIKQKQETKTGPTFKLPKIGFSDIDTEGAIPKINVNVKESTTKIKQLTTEETAVKEDPYEQLSKSDLSRTKLPKREDIEIPGMEDMSRRTTAKGMKEPKAVFTGHYEDIQAETVQMSIDVDSVKEAVSKLPGFKLPKVDTSGVPIPEEITVIDANAQRISVKTPTKIKQEAHLKFDVTASPEISKTTVRLPKVTPADITSEELLTETMIPSKTHEKEYKIKQNQSDKEVYIREHIVIPGKESVQEVAVLQTQGTDGIKYEYESEVTLKSKKAKKTMPSFGIGKPDIRIPDFGIDLPKQKISEQKGDNVKGERTIFLQEVKTSKTETRNKIGGVTSEVEIPEIEGIEYIDSVDSSPSKDGGINLTGLGVNIDVASPKADISFQQIKGNVKDVEAEELRIKLPKFGAVSQDISVNVPDADTDINIGGAEIKRLESEGKGAKFKIPNLSISMPKVKGPNIDLSQSKKNVGDTLQEAKAEVDITLGNVDVSIPKQKMEVKKTEMEIKPWQAEGELDEQGSKFKKPKFGIKIPKLKGPEFDLSLSDVTLPEAKAEVKLQEASEITLGNVDVSITEPKLEVEKPEVKIQPLQTDVELERQGGKFQIPKFGITLPKVKGPDIHFGLSKKDGDVTLPEAKAKVPDAPKVDVSLGKVDVSPPKGKMEVKKPVLEMQPVQSEFEIDRHGSKFKMPKLGMSMPKVKGPDIHFGLSKKDGNVTLPEAKAEVKVPEVELKEPSANVEIKAPEIKVGAKGTEGSPSKFKMPAFKLPKFGVGTPNVSVEVPDMDKHVKIDEADINITDEGSAVHIAAPSIDIKGPSIDIKPTGTEQDGKGGKLKMPHGGFSMPKVKGPKIDLNLSKKDIDVKIPETKTDVNLPEAGLKKVDVSIPEAKMEVKKPEMEMQILQTGGELDGQDEKFKMPKFGIKMPKVKGPEFDLSLSKKEVDVSRPEAKADVNLPDVELKQPSFKVEMKAPEIEVVAKDTEGSPSKFKMPSFGFSMPKVKGPDIDLSLSKKDTDITLPGTKAEIKLPEVPNIDASLGKAEVFIPEAKVEVEKPEVEIKPLQTDIELEGHGGKFQMPKFGITMPKVKGPEIDSSFSKKDVDVTQLEAKAQAELPEASNISVDMKPPEFEAEIDGQGSKFKLPKFGISMPKVKGPEIDFSSSKKDADITLPEAKAEVSLPQIELKEPSAKVEIKSPEIEAQLSSVKGSPSKFKMPTFKFPKFGAATPNVSAEVPDIDKEIKMDGADSHISVPRTDVDLPEVKAEVHLPEVEVKKSSGSVVIEQPGVEVDARLKKPRFSLPRFSFSKSSVKAPEVDAGFQDVDVNIAIPEGKVEVKGGEVDMKQSECEAEVDGQGSKFKIPKFGITMPKVTGPDIDLNLSKKDVDVTLPEAKAEVQLPDVKIKQPSAAVEVKVPDIEAQTGNVEGKGSKFKLPSLGFSGPQVKLPDIDLGLSKKDVDVTIPEAKAEVKVPDVKLRESTAKMEIKAPGIDVQTSDVDGSSSTLKMPTFKLPRFGVTTPQVSVEVPAVDKDIKIDGASVDVTAPSMDTEGPSVDVKAKGSETEGQGSKFKMPKFGISMPKVKGPEIDLSLSKKDVDVTLPEAKAEITLPKVEVKEPKVDIKAPEITVAAKDTEGSPSKFKMPTFKLPKFGGSTPSATVEVPDMDKSIKIDGADIKIPEEVLAVHIAAPSIDTEGPSIEVKNAGIEHEGKGGKFKLPSLGFSGPQVKRPDIDLSLSQKDVDLTLPEAKADVKLPDVGLKEPSAEVDIKGPKVKVATKSKEGSPSKFKMPTFKLPKFGVSTPSATVDVPDRDVKIDGADIEIPEEVLAVHISAPSIDTERPSIDIQTTGAEHEGKGSKFKLPSLGFSGPQVKRPDIDLSFSKKDVDVTLPEAEAEVKLPDVELKESSVKVEIKAPEIDVQTSNVEGSPSKFKMPSFKLPKFGAATPEVSVGVPDVEKGIKVDGADLTVKLPDVEIKEPVGSFSVSEEPMIEGDAKLKKTSWTLPRFSFSKTSVKAPEAEVNLDAPKVDITLPEAKTDVHLPDIDTTVSSDISIEGAPAIDLDAKFKKPRFSLPRFSFSKQSSKESNVDVTLPDMDASLPEVNVEVKQPEVEFKPPESNVELESQENKFKMPKFGISMPKIKGPEIDLSLSKKDVDVTLPEATAEVQLPDVKIKQHSVTVETMAPEIEAQTPKVKESPSKLKMPTFKFPTFGAATPKVSVEVPEVDKDIKIDGASVAVTAPSIDTEGLSIDMKAKGSELEGPGSKFKMPKFGISMPRVKGPEIDLSLSKKDVDVTIPEAKAEVKLPDVELKESTAKVEIKSPGIDVQTSDVEGSPSKLKMPTFKLPKFGVATPQVSVEVTEVDKDNKIDGATVDVTAPSMDTEGLSVDVKAKGSEIEGSGSRFKMPKFGISMPKVKGPEIDLSLSKKDVDVTLPEAKAEITLPKVEVKEPKVDIKAPEITVAAKDTEGSPSKFKMPTFKLPKFGGSTPSATVDVPDRDVKIDGTDIEIPEEVLAVHITAPSIDTERPSIDIKTTGAEHEGKGSKFKLPSLGFSGPQVKRPDIDLSLSKKDVDLTLPEAKADVKLPDVGLKEPSAEVDIKGPKIKVATKSKEGSPSKFKMPTFKLPKFGVSTPSTTADAPDRDVKIDGADIEIPEEVLAVHISAPSIDTKHPSIDIKTTGAEHEGKGSKFKLPSLGFSGPQVKRPDIDLSFSKKDVDVTLPEVKAEVKLPDVGLKESTAKVEIKAPEIDVQTGNVEGSPSKFKMPTFKLPTFGAATPKVSVEVPDVEKDIKIDGATVDVKAPSMDTEGLSVDVKTKGSEIEGPGSRFKMPKFGISMPKVKGPEIDLSSSKKDVDLTIPEAKADVQLPDVNIKPPSATVEIKAPKIEAQRGNVEGKGSRFKLPSLGFSGPQIKRSEIDLGLSNKDIDVTIPEAKAEVKLPEVELKPEVEIKPLQTDIELEGHGGKFQMPKFGITIPKVKGPEIDSSFSKKDVDVTQLEAKAQAELPEASNISVDMKPPEFEAEIDGQGSKFKLPKFGISMPKVKGPEIDFSSSKKDADITLPEAKAEVSLPQIELKEPSAKVEIKSPEIEAQLSSVKGSPSKFKMPTFKLPTFGAATPKVSVEVPDVEKDIQIDGASVDVTADVDKDIKLPKVKGPEVDLSLSKENVDVTLPEVKAEIKLPSAEVKEPKGAISVPDPSTVETETKVKRPSWTFPKFSFSRTGGKAPDVDVNIETPKVDFTSPEAKAEVQGPSGSISMEEPPAAELDANLKKAKFSLPGFSFSKSSVKEPEVSAELPRVDVSLPEGEVIVTQPEIKIKAPELEAELDGQGSKFKLPKFGISVPKAKGLEEDSNAPQKDLGITLPEVKAEVKLPQTEVKESTAGVEIKASSKDASGSPLKFKMPTLKTSIFGVTNYDVTVEAPDADKVAETDGAKHKENVTVNIKGPNVDIKTDVSKAAITYSETPKTETDNAGLGSPSKFKLPSIKMPKLTFAKPNIEDEHVPVDTERKDQPEMEAEPKGEIKSPKMSFTSIGEMLKNIDVEFDVSNTEENLETSKEVNESDQNKLLQAKEKETTQDTIKSPERTSWFKFPKFGLSSPTKPAKITETNEQKDEKSPVGETVDEEVSPTCSVQSSDAFADISSAMTSEHTGLSLSSPTKVTVKYSDPSTTSGLGETHSNIITSTTRTELISVEPNLPEKITILSPGVSSSSEDTLRLESKKIHVITSNIQATPEAQRVQIQSAGGLPLESMANKAESWTVEDSQSGKRTVYERHLVRETSSERSESKETIVITKQITSVFDSSEPISGETASSIQRLRDTVHSEKMRFFDGAEK